MASQLIGDVLRHHHAKFNQYTVELEAGRKMKIGDELPDVSFDLGYPAEKVRLKDLCDKFHAFQIVGLPSGPFSTKHLDDYVNENKSKVLDTFGIHHIAMFGVNDGAVMKAWAESQNVNGKVVQLYADPRAEVTKALDLVLFHPAVSRPDTKRFSMSVLFCKIQSLYVSYSQDDPFDVATHTTNLTMADQLIGDVVRFHIAGHHKAEADKKEKKEL